MVTITVIVSCKGRKYMSDNTARDAHMLRRRVHWHDKVQRRNRRRKKSLGAICVGGSASVPKSRRGTRHERLGRCGNQRRVWSVRDVYV